MRLGVISDTHAHLHNTRLAVRMLESLDVEAVLHCGDICSAEIPPLLAAWPTHYVYGNCDHELPALKAAIEAAGHSCHELFGDLSLGGRRIALLHSHDVRQFRRVKT